MQNQTTKGSFPNVPLPVMLHLLPQQRESICETQDFYLFFRTLPYTQTGNISPNQVVALQLLFTKGSAFCLQHSYFAAQYLCSEQPCFSQSSVTWQASIHTFPMWRTAGKMSLFAVMPSCPLIPRFSLNPVAFSTISKFCTLFHPTCQNSPPYLLLLLFALLQLHSL